MSVESRTNDLLNNPGKWGQHIPAPSEVDIWFWQEQIDKIAGVSPIGSRPVLRLIWGWDSLIWRNGGWRQRYVFYTVNLPNGDTVDIATPRWFIEELVEPAQYMDDWERNRWTVKEDTLTLEDTLGEPPRDGIYVAAYPVAEHEYKNHCCLRQWAEERRRCVGKYRPPGAVDLEIIEKAVRKREEARMHNRPDQPIAREVLDECFKLNYEQKAKHDDDVAYHAQMLAKDFVNSFGENFTSDDPVRWKHGKYRFQSGSIISGATDQDIAKYTKPGFKKVDIG